MDLTTQIKNILEEGRFEILEEPYNYITLHYDIKSFREDILPLLTPNDFFISGRKNLTLILSSTSDSKVENIINFKRFQIIFQAEVALFVASFPSDALHIPGLIVSIYEGLAKKNLPLVCTFTLHTTTYYVVHNEDRNKFLDVFYAIIEDVRQRFRLDLENV